MFYLEGATFGLFLGSPVRPLRSFSTKDITAHNHPKYAHQNQKKVFNLATKYFETGGKTNMVLRKNYSFKKNNNNSHKMLTFM